MEACVSAASPSKRKGRRELQSARERPRLCVTSTRPSLRALCLCFPVRQVGETASAPSSRCEESTRHGQRSAQHLARSAPGGWQPPSRSAAASLLRSVVATRGRNVPEHSRQPEPAPPRAAVRPSGCRQHRLRSLTSTSGWVRRALDRDGHVAPAFGACKLRRASSSSELLVL